MADSVNQDTSAMFFAVWFWSTLTTAGQWVEYNVVKLSVAEEGEPCGKNPLTTTRDEKLVRVFL